MYLFDTYSLTSTQMSLFVLFWVFEDWDGGDVELTECKISSNAKQD